MPTTASPEGPVALLSLQEIVFGYPGAPAPVFSRLSADLPAGVALVCGDEERGKSSLLRLLAGQLQPSAGRCLWAGSPLRPEQVAAQDAKAAERDHQVVQAVLDELVAPDRRAPLAMLIQGLDLASHVGKPLYQLSTGSRRKVFLAAALAQQASLTLLDQPFMALDRPSVDFLCAQFQAWVGSADRLLLIADYLPPQQLPLSFTLDLDRPG